MLKLLRRIDKTRKIGKTRIEELSLRLKGRRVKVTVRRNPRANRLILRVDGASDGLILTLPRGVSLEEGLSLVRRKADWALERLDELPKRLVFEEGAIIPFRGRDHIIQHAPEARRGVWREGGVIYVSGMRQHLSRRVTDWLKAEARRVILPMAFEKADRIHRVPTRITIRDTRSRWGSCTQDGKLSFSWRLILAPPHVLDYVVAHEVAHLKHMNHGPRFWACADGLAHRLTSARDWMDAHGAALHRIG